MALYRSTVNYKLALCHLCAVFFSPFRLLFVSPVFLSLENTWSCAEHITAVSSLAHVVSVLESWLSLSIFAKTIKLPNMSYSIFNCCSHSLFSWPEVCDTFYKRLVSCSVIFYEI